MILSQKKEMQKSKLSPTKLKKTSMSIYIGLKLSQLSLVMLYTHLGITEPFGPD